MELRQGNRIDTKRLSNTVVNFTLFRMPVKLNKLFGVVLIAFMEFCLFHTFAQYFEVLKLYYSRFVVFL